VLEAPREPLEATEEAFDAFDARELLEAADRAADTEEAAAEELASDLESLQVFP
jgi:hypothetical protein